MTDSSCTGYSAEASALGAALDIRISEIRAMQDSGAITCVQAADMRIEALENHLTRMRELRAEHFGDDDLPGPNFYPSDGPRYGGEAS